jgi:asparagine synthase (glutamine-hydrolysing)
MISHDSRYVMVFNGEIYNAEALRARLDGEGAALPWRGHSDTEVLLEWISRHGLTSALEAAAGMFAIGLWDRLERRLLLARDRAGEKPLYYGWAGTTLLFASELKAFRAVEDFDHALDPSAEAAFASYGYVPAPLCIYRDARKLPPGGWLAWKPEEGRCWPEVERWWSIEAVAASSVTNPITDSAVADAMLEDTLSRAVRRQMSSDVPLGAFLSGGIDSSLVVALMQAHSPQPVQTFTVAFEEATFDESESAAEVAQVLGTVHHALRVSAQDVRSVVPTLAEMYDEPFADASQIPTSLIAEFARRHVTVALSGDGADELFAGYNRYRLLPRLHRQIGHWPRLLRTGVAACVRHAPHPVMERLAKSAGASGTVARRLDDLSAMLTVADRPASLYQASLRVWPEQGLATDDDTLVDDFLPWMMLRDFGSYLTDDVLTKLDRAAMYHSLETRCPFLDPEVIGLAWRMPVVMRIVDGQGKRPLRRLLGRYLPQALIDRPKAGFTPPIVEWIRGPLVDWAEQMLAPARLEGQSAFAPSVVSRLWLQHRMKQADHGRSLWPVLMFSAWRERWDA